ncbi:hypothetical protein HK097_005222, partial [Rhizophlyctis rosea]
MLTPSIGPAQTDTSLPSLLSQPTTPTTLPEPPETYTALLSQTLTTLITTLIIYPLRVERERWEFDWLTPWHANPSDLREFLEGTLERSNPRVDLYIRFRYGNGYRWSAVRGVKQALEEWDGAD